MDHNSRAFARNMFRLKVHQSDGQAYEDFFVGVMRLADPEFESVRPYGNVGDRKNDGFNPRTGTYYQVYAPVDCPSSEKTALEKVTNDLAGLVDFWNPLFPVKRFHFVLNDKYQSVGPPLREKMVALQQKYQLEEASVLLSHHLEQVTFSLKDDEIVMIVGHVPGIEADEFLFLSGFTFFMGAWMDFERTARRCLRNDSPRKSVGQSLIGTLHGRDWISNAEWIFLMKLNDIRNPLVHGDSTELPKLEVINQLVEITERMKAGKWPIPGGTIEVSEQSGYTPPPVEFVP